MSLALDLVEGWHAALNSGEVDAMLRLAHSDVKIVGPRGAASGAQVMRDWFGRANVRLIPLQWFARDNTVVVEQRGEWLDESGEVNSTAIVASVFAVAENLIVELHRYDDLATALTAASLTSDDAISLA